MNIVKYQVTNGKLNIFYNNHNYNYSKYDDNVYIISTIY